MTENKNTPDLIKSKLPLSKLPEIKQYSHEELLQAATFYYKSQFLPEHIKTMEACYIAMRWALALSIDPFLGLRDIFVIDNIPSLRTEAALALALSSGFVEYQEQYFEGKAYEDNYTAVFKVKVKGQKEHISKFSVKQAKLAMLWGKRTKNNKATAWITYPDRMLMYRAIGFGLRDQVPQVLRGARLYEEIIDYSQYEVVEDNSTNGEVKVQVQKKGSNTMRNDLPPDDIEDVTEIK